MSDGTLADARSYFERAQRYFEETCRAAEPIEAEILRNLAEAFTEVAEMLERHAASDLGPAAA